MSGRRSHAVSAITSALFIFVALASGRQDWMTEAELDRFIRETEAQLSFETGSVTVGDQLATIDLPTGFRFLRSDDARYVLEDLWGNAPDPTVIGLIVPPGQRVPVGWMIAVAYEDVGYVKDGDVGSLDFDELLREMQREEAKENETLRSQGYAAGRTLGWAERPHYDATTHKLYWARRLSFDGEPEITVNYDVRILGRRGILLLAAIGCETELPLLRRGCQLVLERAEFTPGNRYEDYEPGVDKVAVYGIGGLIAGNVLLKTGLLKVLLKPLLVVGAVIVAIFARIFTRR
ncbi:MAG: DUF2167 domain-containing protein [Planctomycetota bacterium]|nr:DUF2167 domain-containing protein [Planctomycetota bacterium]